MAKAVNNPPSDDYLPPPGLVSRFTTRHGAAFLESGAAADGRQESENPNEYKAVPPVPNVPAPRLRTRSAIALGGLAGNNAHGAGFLEALRRAGKLPQLISCTSGQILHVAEFLKGTDLLAYFAGAMQQTQPFGDWTDANLIYKQMSAGSQVIRPSTSEMPGDIFANLTRAWTRALSDPVHFSLFREMSNIQPARSLVPAFPANFYSDIATTLQHAAVGVIFNAYDIETGHELVYMNEVAQRLTGKLLKGQTSMKNANHAWIDYRPINPQTVEQALYLYQYGFDGGTKTVDGAYVRDVILSEIPHPDNDIDRIVAVRPQPDNWLGDVPQSNVELQSLQTQVAFNATYIGERERIQLINRLSQDLNWDPKPKQVSILELPLCEPRTWWDYVLESDQIFRSAFWRGTEVVKYL